MFVYLLNLRTLPLTALFIISLVGSALSQNTFRSVTNGNWDDASTWTSGAGAGGTEGIDYPSQFDTIYVDHDVVIDATNNGADFVMEGYLEVGAGHRLTSTVGNSNNGFVLEGDGQFHLFGEFYSAVLGQDANSNPITDKEFETRGNSYFVAYSGAYVLVGDDWEISGNCTIYIENNVCIRVEDDVTLDGTDIYVCGDGDISINTGGANTLNFDNGAGNAQICSGVRVIRNSGSNDCTLGTVEYNSGTGSNLPPTAYDDFFATQINTAQNQDVLNQGTPDFHPVIGDTITLTSAGDNGAANNGATTQGGTVSVNNNGTPTDPTDDFILYTPPTAFTGTDTYDYIITEEDGGTAQATVSVFIACSGGLFIEAATTLGLATTGNKDGGLTWYDFNRDNLVDVLVNTDDNTLDTRLYFQQTDGTFTDVTATNAAALTSNNCERTAIAADLNNDGYIDFVRNTFNRVEVWLNNGPSAATPYSFDLDQAITSNSQGINIEGIGFVDWDQDGFLDMIMDSDDSEIVLFENDGDGTFTEETVGTGLPTGDAGVGDYSATTDWNNDGYIDYAPRKSDGGTADFWLFDESTGQFTALDPPNLATSGGEKGAITFCDVDQDGDFDFIWAHQSNDDATTVYTQNDDGSFSLRTTLVTDGGVEECDCADVDNDGDNDIFLGDDNGTSYLFKNNTSKGGALSFAQDNDCIDASADVEGAEFIDLDNDGDEDLYLNINGAANQLWINSQDDNNYITVEPRYRISGSVWRPATGANVMLSVCGGDTCMIKDVNAGRGHGSQSGAKLHFGLGGSDLTGPNDTYAIITFFPDHDGTGPDTVYQRVVPSTLSNQTLIVYQDDASDTPCPPVFRDADGDGVADGVDIDDDNDGVLDVDECLGELVVTSETGFFSNAQLDFGITGDVGDPSQPQTLNSITVAGTVYNQFILPDSFNLNFVSGSVDETDVRILNECVEEARLSTDGDALYDQNALPAFQSPDLNYYQMLDTPVDSTMDYYDVYYDQPILSNGLVYIAFSERGGNNRFAFEAIDPEGNSYGQRVELALSNYDDTGYPVRNSACGSTQNAEIAVLPIQDLAPIGSLIKAVRTIPFTDGSDAGDGKIFIFGTTNSLNGDCDSDGDGIPNGQDLDSDNDGIPDIVESGGIDTNGDGLVDDTTDTDGDGWVNQFDTTDGGTPLPNLDADRDGTFNKNDIDADNDGILDVIEAGGTADTNGRIVNALTDTDMDGFADAVDGDVGNDGTTENTANALTITGPDNGSGRPLFYPNDDFDGDTLLNFYDIDADNDGIIDNIEAQATAATIEPSGNDSDRDGLDDNYENGGFTPTNTDGVDNPDYLDLDSDNDGYFDIVEAWDFNNDFVPDSTFTGTDTDGDGLDDGYDLQSTVNNTTNVSNNGQDGTDMSNVDDSGTPERDWRETLDTDGDGVADDVDIDTDNDGILDLLENGNNSAYGDEDGDGIINFIDTLDNGAGDGSTTNYTDADGNGIPDVYDNDGDGIPNHLDLDSDNDGITDLHESGLTVAELNALDINNDGIIDPAQTFGANGLADNVETAAESGIIDYTSANSDGNGPLDFLDLDSDNDGIFDIVENGNGTDADNNGIVDGSTDADRDGVLDSADGDEATRGTTNADATDSDVDGTPNYRDLDSDADGITDFRENGSNLGTDANNDGRIDGSADADNDGILDEPDNDDSTVGSPNTQYENTDGDAFFDAYDIDADGDGIIDLIESQASTGSPTIPIGTDTDGDGIDNNFETGGTTPVDTDSDGVPDYLDTDSDNDGKPDIREGYDTNGDGVADTNPAGTDGDGDGLDDNFDNQPTASALDNSGNMGQNALNFPNTEETTTSELDWREAADLDNDGVPDYLDVDDDNDGISDFVERICTRDTMDWDNNAYTPNAATSTGTTDGRSFNFSVSYVGPGSRSTLHGTSTAISGGLVPAENALLLFQNWDNDQGLNVATASADSALNNVVLNLFDIDHGIGGTNVGFHDSVEVFGFLNGVRFIPEVTSSANNSVTNSIIEGDTNLDNTAPSSSAANARVVFNTPIDSLVFFFGQSFNTADDPGQQGYSIHDFYFDNCTDLDSDGDGIIDARDLDSDNDGIPDIVEAGGVDTDGNGRVDNFTDTDGDGMTNAYDTTNGGVTMEYVDNDGDGIPNMLDLDSDNDGIPDLIEAGGIDTDGDGIVDNQTDNDDDGYADIYDSDDDGAPGIDDAGDQLITTGTDTDADGSPNSYATGDTDGDGILDQQDLDADNDGIPDLIEAGGVDTDGDGIVDNLIDADNDGFADVYDPDDDGAAGDEDPTDPLVRTDGTDTDGDGKADDAAIIFEDGENNNLDTDGDDIPDWQDLDSDNDGIPDLIEAGGVDTDGDGIVDNLTDADNDGFADVYDPDDDGTAGDEDATDPLVRTDGTDTDGDGKADDAAIVFEDGENNNLDTDSDDIPDWQDLDSDNDGIPDLIEAGGVDTDGDGIVDNLTDADNDGFSDVYDPDDDGTAGDEDATDPLVRTDGTDTDGDGKADDAAIIFEDGENRDLDSDGDDIPDWNDLDSDNDGIPDVVELGGEDEDGNGQVDVTTDADNDGFADVYDSDDDGAAGIEDANDPLLETGGTDTDGDGKADDVAITYTDGAGTNQDTDSDGDVDHLDIDADNDGIVDAIEAGGTSDANGRLTNATTDTDNDGFGDSVDGDVGNDGTAENTGNALTATGGDTDNDGRPDSFPNDDADGDDRYNFQDIDADGDGIIDNIEGQISTSETEPNTTDANNDGLSDAFPNNGLTPVDTDSDGTPDYLDTDSDNDQVPDVIEGWDTTGDNVAETLPSGTDTDGDGLDNAFDDQVGPNQTTNPSNAGEDADQFPNLDNTSTAELDWREAEDNDRDGIPDYVDIDDDNDGIADSLEIACDPSLVPLEFANGTGSPTAPITNISVLVDGVTTQLDVTEVGTGQFQGNNDGTIRMNSGANSTTIATLTFEEEVSLVISSHIVSLGGNFDLNERWRLRSIGETFTVSDPSNHLTDPRTGANIVDGDMTDTVEFFRNAGGLGGNLDWQITTTPARVFFIDYENISGSNNIGQIRARAECIDGDRDGDGIVDRFDLDSDNDGIPDLIEAGGVDTNGDGVIDDLTDADNDGLANTYDPDFITGDAISNPDTDGDGINDAYDLDADNDGIPDLIEAGGIDTDGDGIVDDLTDADNDGYSDIYDSDDDGTVGVEDATDPLILTGTDTDSDGDPDSYATGNTDTDGDGIPNQQDLDADNDGIPDLIEAGGVDTDGDGIVDDLTDADNDGFADEYDPNDDGAAGDEDPTDPLVRTDGTDTDGDGKADDAAIIFENGENVNADNDGDGFPDYVDRDSDNDGIPDLIEAGGIDTDGDGIVDNLTDADDDGFSDIYDPNDDGAAGDEDPTDPLVRTDGTDTDGDGKADDAAIVFEDGENRDLDSDGDDIPDWNDLDSDNDGIPDIVELGGEDENGDGQVDVTTDADNDGFADVYDSDDDGAAGIDDPNDPLLETGGTDTDGDGKADDVAITYTDGAGTNQDTDRDGDVDHLDIDADNDGIVDAIEAGGTADANGRLVGATTDTDNDGFGDSVDGDVGNDGTAENTGNALTATGGDTDNDGRPNSFPNDDADGDDRYNFQDIDADGDGIIDNIEGQISTSETEPNTTDANNDGLSDAFPNNGLQPVDTDSDGTPDYLDTDSDNDGFTDAIEGWDTDGDNIANTTPSGTDTDGDGLDNAFDLEPTASNTDNPANNGQDADQFPNGDNSGTPELDWREAQDTDDDGIADNVDLDVDNDGIPNSTENNGQDPYGDEDGDGIPNFLDTTDNGNGGDGSTTNYTDANGDGTPDIYDTDLDGVPDFLDLDSDNDGITDLEEADGGNVLTDANGDGRIDGPITDADNDGYHDPLDNEDGNQVAQGSEVESGTPLTNPNTDGRGNPNYLDIDADDDGITDLVESQATTGTPLIPTGTDTDGDGIDDRFDVDCAPCGGITGTAIVPVNTDGADTPDYIDTNSDNDGESDFIEANDANDDGVADVTINATDTDGDGLLDIFTDGVAVGVTTNPHNNGQDANDFPDHDGGASERDWREQPCAGGVATLAPDNATTSATASCKDGDWTYYYNPGDPTELLFAIEKQPSGGGANTNDFEVEVSITTSPNPQVTSGVFSRENAGIPQATFVMGRYWNLNITSGSLNGTVNTRFFYRTSELNQMVSTANAWNTANAGGTSFTSGTRFFTMDNGTFDHTTGDLTTAGIADAFEITSTTAGVEDGVTFVEFNNVPALTGGGIAFTVNNNSVILPVELTKFDAEKDEANRAVNVTWETATEINNDYFEVQRSATGRDGEYEVIATVKGQGNSTVIHNYETVDQNPLNGTSYYRLNQVDFDGTATLSDAVAVNFETKAISSSGITAFPNPFGDKVWLKLESTATSSFGTAKMIVVTDATGRPVYSTEMPAGAQSIELPLDELSNGLYQINVTTESGAVTLPVVRGR